MIRRSTWIVLGIAVALILGYVLWQRYQTDQAPEAEAAPTFAPVVTLFDMNDLSVSGMTFSRAAGGQTVVVQRDAATGAWSMPDVPAETVDSERIAGLVGQLLSMMVERTLGTDLSLADVGLDAPAYTIQLAMEDGRQQVLRVGDVTAIGTGYYVQLDQGAPVIVAKVDLDYVLGIIDTPPLLPTATPAPTDTPAADGAAAGPQPEATPSATPGG